MSVYRRFNASEFPSLVTTNVADHWPLFTSVAAARLLIEVLYEVRSENYFGLLAFVVMPNHIHLILKPPPSHRLGQIIQLIKGRFARQYNKMTGRSGRLWQSRYHERTLRNERELMAAIEYVYQNPVAAGLVNEAVTFAWSSANQGYPTDLAMYLGQAEA